MAHPPASPVRLCIITSTFPRFEGDWAGSFLLAWAKELKPEYEPVIVAPASKECPADHVIDGISVVRVSYFYPSSLQRLAYGDGMLANLRSGVLARLQVPIFLVRLFWQAYRVARATPLIVSHWMLPAGLVGAILQRMLGRRHILVCHSGGVHLLGRLPFRTPLARFIVRHTDRVITVSQDLKDKLLSLLRDEDASRLADRISVAPMGVPPALASLRSPGELRKMYGISENKVVLYLGRLHPIKGVEYLIASLAGATDVRLIIAGTGRSEPSLQTLARRLRVNAQFVGAIVGQKKSHYLELSDVIVVPSVRGSDAFEEGLPVVLLEAMSYGKPVVATCTGGIPEVVRRGRNGLLVPPSDPEALGEAIRDLLGDPERACEMGSNGLIDSERFSLNRVGATYRAIIQQVMAEEGHTPLAGASRR